MTLVGVWQDILDRVGALERRLPSSGIPVTAWATVTSVTPLRVRTDDATVLDVPTDTLVAGLGVGDRVRVELYGTTGRRVVVVGTAGGEPLPHPAAATIRHVEESTYSYEVIVTSPSSVSLVYADGALADGRQYRQTPRDKALGGGFGALVTAGGWHGATGGSWSGSGLMRPVGLGIIDGRVVQDFGAVDNGVAGAGTEALVMLRRGTLAVARQSDGRTAQEWVQGGALWAAGYGPVIVEGGSVRSLTGGAWDYWNQPSGWTILGQRADGALVIIQTDGVSGSWGLSGFSTGALALAHGCVTAILLDGGGSAQTWWGGHVSHPSTDTSGQRAVGGGFLAVHTPVAPYDSGPVTVPTLAAASAGELDFGDSPPLQVRQRGGHVFATIAANWGATGIPPHTWTQLSTGAIPRRYCAPSVNLQKGVVTGGSNTVVNVSCDSSTGVLSVRPINASGSNIVLAVGEVTWPAAYA